MSTDVQCLQALFAEFNQKGSTAVLDPDGPEPSRLGVMDSYHVLRAADPVFWLMMKGIAYHDGAHHAHTIKVVSWSQEDGWELDLVDDIGRRFHIELIFPETEPDLVAGWAQWQEYKARNRKRFDLIDQGMLAEQVRKAVNWS